MSVMQMLPKDDPIMLAWEAYTNCEDYDNTRKWALNEDHVDGSLWAAFLAGWSASRREVNEQRTALTGSASDQLQQSHDRLVEALEGLIEASTTEANEKGAGGFLLARLSDARSVYELALPLVKAAKKGFE